MTLVRATLLLSSLIAAPALSATREDAQAWINLTATGSIGPRALYFVEVQPRFAEDDPNVAAVLLRGAIGWKLSDRVSVHGGFLHAVLPQASGPDRSEERPFVQLNWSIGRPGGGALTMRTRLEHRRVSDGSDVGWRARSMLRYVHPIGDPKRTRALVSVEPFVAFNDADWGARKGLDQVRTFAGFEVPLAGRSTIEAGYLNQAINGPGPANRMNHVVSLALFIRP